MRTKDELFREALRHIAARRQQAVTAAERDRAAALAAHPELRAAEDARTHAGLTLTLAAARGADQTAAAAALKAADERPTAAYAPNVQFSSRCAEKTSTETFTHQKLLRKDAPMQ